MPIAAVRELPYTELLTWQQYFRDCGDTNDILVRGLLALIQTNAAKRVKPEQVFPFLKEPPGMSLADRIMRALDLSGGRGA